MNLSDIYDCVSMNITCSLRKLQLLIYIARLLGLSIMEF